MVASEWNVTHMEVLALRGDVGSAIEYALAEVLSEPVTDAFWVSEVFEFPYMVAVAEDPRVRARLQQWEEDLVQLRVDLRPVLHGAR
jgi:hypothetical protein